MVPASQTGVIMGKPVDNDKPPVASKGLRLRVTEDEHSGLKREAESYGYDLSTL